MANQRPEAKADCDRRHAAAGHLVDGRWHAAADTLENVSIDHPRDILALQVGHQIDFFTGNARMLRDRIGRALPAWNASWPGHHDAVLGDGAGRRTSGG